MSQTPPPPPPPPGGYGPPPPGGYGAPAPGGPGFGTPQPGGLLDRFLARLIDGVVLGIVYAIVAAIFGAILISSTHYDPNKGEFVGGSRILYSIVLGIVMSIVFVGYQAFMESSRGQSLGKMAMKLKVVGSDGVSNPTLEQAIKRNIFMAAPIGVIIPVVGGLITGLAAFVGEVMIAVGVNSDTAKRQGWHDKFAGTTQVLKIG